MKFPTFEERHAAHIRPEMLALSKREAPVTLAEWQALRVNGYELHIIAPRLDDEAFAYAIEHNLKNCRLPGVAPYRSYDEALVGFYAPEMLRRWRAAFAARFPPSDPCDLCGQPFDVAPHAPSGLTKWACSRCDAAATANEALPPSEHARVALLAGGPLALAALMSTGPEAAQRIIDAQRGEEPRYTEAEVEELARHLRESGGFSWDDTDERTRAGHLRAVRDALASNDIYSAPTRAALDLMRRAEERGRADERARLMALTTANAEVSVVSEGIGHAAAFDVGGVRYVGTVYDRKDLAARDAESLRDVLAGIAARAAFLSGVTS